MHQYLLEALDTIVRPAKATIIYGPSRIGKTTLLNKYHENAI